MTSTLCFAVGHPDLHIAFLWVTLTSTLCFAKQGKLNETGLVPITPLEKQGDQTQHCPNYPPGETRQ
ncbi:hypothetical protein ACOMHN_058388 [Nucella lapillus]